MRWLVFGVMALGLLLRPAPAMAAGTVLTLSAQPVQVDRGEKITVTATLQDAQGLYGFELHLKFDPALLQVAPDATGTAALPGDLLSADFVAQNRFDNAGGTIDFSVVQVSPTQPVTGTGTLGTFALTAVAGGRATIALESFVLSDIDGLKLPAQVNDVQITIGAAGSVDPTAQAPVSPSATPATAPTARVAAVAPPGLPTAAVAHTVVSAPNSLPAAEPATSAAPPGLTATPEVAMAVMSPTPDAAAEQTGSANTAATAPSSPDPQSGTAVPQAPATAEPESQLVSVAAMPTAQRLAIARSNVPSLPQAPSRIDTQPAAAQGNNPVWLLVAGIGFLALACALLLAQRIASKARGAKLR